ncbi:MAG TPA: hypothetical protein VNO32_19085, partial [Candidatus Acidoferrum sp.]|nr:hypothetical protein [Candidatus Acidoferrum sp.]
MDKFQKFLPILLDRDLGAKLLNTVTVRLIHSEAEVLQYSLYKVCSMSNAAKYKPGCRKALRLLVHRYCSSAVRTGRV